jgi:hypothetical protein
MSSSIIPFKSIVLFPRDTGFSDDHFTVTVIYSSGNADAENPAKTTEWMVNSALKWQLLSQGIIAK